MTKWHVNPETGDAGVCHATKRACPLGEENHYTSPKAARDAFENEQEVNESGATWPPIGLPKKLHAIATGADLLRHYNDSDYDGGEGVCLGASALVSYKLAEKGIPHKLVHGTYHVPHEEEARAHWWVESSGWIIDASRGQFPEKEYHSSVVRNASDRYEKTDEWDHGHKTLELVSAELKRCFADPYEAEFYLDNALQIFEESEDL